MTLFDFNGAITKNKDHLLPSFLPNKVNCWPVRKRLDNDKTIRISITLINISISISNYNNSSCLSQRFYHHHQLSKQFEIDEVPVGKDGVEDDGGDEEDGEDGNPVIDVKPDQGLGNIGCLRSHPVHPNIGWW